MAFAVRAITLDLDDTVWPFAPIGVRIERVLDEWMRRHSPATAEMFPVEGMRALRERVATEHPALYHDMSALRRLTLEAALRESGGDVALADAAYDAFFAERNKVECYPDAIHALERISAVLPIAALSNGNADLARIGLDHLFTAQLSACSFGSAKPDPAIFLAACELLGVPPAEVLHVGDHPEADVAGAARAGLRSCWINRADDAGHRVQWQHAEVEPDLHFDSLAALADWLEAARSASGERIRSTPA
ncbi:MULTISPECIES: HAD family hydrolase [unclassified Luteimonas]